MSRELYGDLGETTRDNLIAGPRFPIWHKGVSLASGQGVLKRGTVLAIISAGAGVGTAVMIDSSHKVTVSQAQVADRDKPDCVLAEDIDTGAGDSVEAAAYSAGHFIRGSLIFGGSDTWETHELEMRKLNMHMSASVDENGGVH